MKHAIKLTVTMNDEAGANWALQVYAETDEHKEPFPISQGRLSLTSAIISGEAVTSLILNEAKRKGLGITEV
jgi:hypothetical protein